MVGGKVTDIWKWPAHGELVKVVVVDKGEYLGVDLKKNSDSLAITRGDTIWWQSRIACWTPHDRSFVDRHIPRVGFSYHTDGPIHPDRQKWSASAAGEE